MRRYSLRILILINFLPTAKQNNTITPDNPTPRLLALGVNNMKTDSLSAYIISTPPVVSKENLLRLSSSLL